MTDLDWLNKMAAREAENRPLCRNCAWFASREGEQLGECHRMPPVVPPTVGEQWMFPATNRDNSCGEFRHHRTGESFTQDPQRYLIARVAALEEQIERMRAE